MATDNAALSSRVQAAEGGKSTALALQHDLNKWFSSSLSNLASMAGSEQDAKKIFAICLSVLNRNPKLAECTRDSLTSCVAQSMAFGLLPGPFKECAFVPRKNSKNGGKLEANWQPQYQGLIKLAYNGGVLAKLRAEVVWSRDVFSQKKGLYPELNHIPFTGIRAERGERVGAYVVWSTRQSAEPDFLFLEAEQIIATRDRSPASKFSDSPWMSREPDDVDWMWKKTALIQALKLIPKNEKMIHALEADEASEGFVKPSVMNFHIETPEGGSNGAEAGIE